jgi:hypothetical protein
MVKIPYWIVENPIQARITSAPIYLNIFDPDFLGKIR